MEFEKLQEIIADVLNLEVKDIQMDSKIMDDLGADSLDLFEIVKAVYDTCPHDIHVRPDHGRMIWDEVGRPGYGLYDRALGATYLNGLWEAIDKLSK